MVDLTSFGQKLGQLLAVLAASAIGTLGAGALPVPNPLFGFDGCFDTS